MSLLLKNAQVYYQGDFKKLDILIEEDRIKEIGENIDHKSANIEDCGGLTIFPGFIDTQVHFREPGDPDKETLESGSKSAALGGVTAVFEMPNTSPPTDNKERFQDKLDRAKGRMYCNYAFYFGATEKNSEDLNFVKDLEGCCGIKMFVGSSTGNLLVKEDFYIEQVIKNAPKVVSIHSEDENMLNERKSFIEEGNVKSHYVWRSPECALSSTKKVVSYAEKHKKRIHVLHISTKDEVDYVRDHKEFVTLETTPQHITLYAPDIYDQIGTLAQMNPPIRPIEHLEGIWKGVEDNTIDVIGSDHAPHTLEQKKQTYPKSPSGMTGVQTIGLIMTDYYLQGKIKLKRLVDLLSSNPCKIFSIKDRGEIKVGNIADLTIYKLNHDYEIKNEWIASNCGWTPFDGKKIKVSPFGTIVNGQKVVWNQKVSDKKSGEPLAFN
jgi:dihydroorotase